MIPFAMIIRRMSAEQERVRERREAEFEERMLNMFPRNMSYSDRQKEDRDFRDVLQK